MALYTDVQELVCSEEHFSREFSIAEHIDAARMSRLLCKAVHDFDVILSESRESFEKVHFQAVVIKTFDFFHSFLYLKNHLDEVEDQLENVRHAWDDFSMSPMAPIIL